MSSNTGRRYLIVTAVSFAMLYGATYQQFRYFDLATPGAGCSLRVIPRSSFTR
jgi:hypothetical protein